MLRRISQAIESILLGVGPKEYLSVIGDRLKFYLFFKYYYQKKFHFYGNNIRWGRDFRKLVIPNSVRISCPEKISIGSNSQIDDFVYLQCDLTNLNDLVLCIGESVRINAHTHILAGSNIEIGNEVLIAPFCLITSNNHRFDLDQSIMKQGMKHSGEIKIENGSWVGQNAKILGGVNLGIQSVVGAGAIVLRGNYPKRSKITGQPSKV